MVVVVVVYHGCYHTLSSPCDNVNSKCEIISVSVAQMAVEDVNNDTDVLSNYRLVLSINDGKCEADVVMKKFIDFIKNKDPSKFRSMVGILGKKILVFQKRSLPDKFSR